jgi:hypothetical protein
MHGDVGDLFTDLSLDKVTDELIHGSAITNMVLKSIDKFLVSLHGINIRKKGTLAHKKFRIFCSVVNSRDVGWYL